jgi:ATP-dependent RNA helicase HelY
MLREQLRAHPCHQCPDREAHARWAERWWRLKRETVGLQRKVEGRTNTVARTFDRICDALEALGYLDETATVVTDGVSGCAGSTPRRTCWLRSACGTTSGSGSTPRRSRRRSRLSCTSRATRRPTSRRGCRPTTSLRRDRDGAALVADRGPRDRARTLPTTTIPGRRDRVGGAPLGPGDRLDEVLRGQEMTAGDFVRRCKQLVDLLDQVAKASTDTVVRRTARKAIDGVLRGVVAADRLD